jgi:hypothetical protein
MNLRWHLNYTSQGLPYHEWFIEFDPEASGEPENYVAFAEALDNAMRKQNMYYDDLIVGKVLQNWWLQVVKTVSKYMKSIGMGGTKQDSKTFE